MVSKNDTVRQIRLPSSLANAADEVFENLNITFSEAVRMFLSETVAKGKLPFRPEEEAGGDLLAMRKAEEDYVDRVLGTSGKPAKDRLLEAIFGERDGKDVPDEELRDWARDVGLGEKFSISCLEELYDSGIFPKNVFSGDIDFDYTDDNNDPSVAYLENIHFVENIRSNIDKTAEKMKANAISAYLNDEYKYKKGER